MLNFQEDAQAFRSFVTEHERRVFNIVLNRVMHVPDAEEITQDVFVDVFRNPNQFRGEASVATWLYRIAMNKCVDHFRKNKRKKSWNRNMAGSSLDANEIKDDFHPGIAAENKEKAKILSRAIRSLPEKQQSAWIMHEMENQSYQEIADVLQLSHSSVESLLFRARQNLRKNLMHIYNEK
jgi:RNA polymerase sigma-70 factor (ECF subfamily)